MTDFRTWLSSQKDRDDVVGDLARDVAHDWCLRARTVTGVRRHLGGAHGVTTRVREAVAQAGLEYQLTTPGDALSRAVAQIIRHQDSDLATVEQARAAAGVDGRVLEEVALSLVLADRQEPVR